MNSFNIRAIIPIVMIVLLSFVLLLSYMPIKAVKIFDEGGELKIGLPNAANDPLITIELCAAAVTNHTSVEANDIIYDLAFQSLAATLPNGMHVALLAIQWIVSPDGDFCIIKLRENVKWSDRVRDSLPL